MERGLSASALRTGPFQRHQGDLMGRILLGVIIGIILVIWLLASCVGAIF